MSETDEQPWYEEYRNHPLFRESFAGKRLEIYEAFLVLKQEIKQALPRPVRKFLEWLKYL